MTDSEELDPEDVFRLCRKASWQEITNDEGSVTANIRTELLVTLSKAINELRNDLKNELSALVERGKLSDSREPMYQAAASYSASPENNYRDLENSINAFGQFLENLSIEMKK